MTAVLPAKDLMARLSGAFPGKLEEAGRDSVLVRADALLEVAAYLKTTAGFELDYFNMVTAVDYFSYFELVYHLTSARHNHSVFLKVRCYDRANPSVPSVVTLWQGADFQEREVFDLFGIRFEGHPNLKRIVLWEGFDGYPLRKDWNR